MSQPKHGDRHTDEVGRVMEWVGDAWTPVCSRDDIPMTNNDEQGWLCCPTCRVRAVDQPLANPNQPIIRRARR